MELYTRLQMWLNQRPEFTREDAIENVEWIALAAIVLVMLVVVGSLLKIGGVPIGGLIVAQILSWLGNWSP